MLAYLEILVAVPLMMLVFYTVHFTGYILWHLFHMKDSPEDQIKEVKKEAPHGHFTAEDLKYMPKN